MGGGRGSGPRADQLDEEDPLLGVAVVDVGEGLGEQARPALGGRGAGVSSCINPLLHRRPGPWD